ncbi:hypothetical protein [Devosia sp. YR412]|uniref:hypothetical protein n=1 Tax=Devosia sp. YR412 TaxID=1881030 RepID=UPI0014813376|nr:hypothetical protein [Devosia sp. YR412]
MTAGSAVTAYSEILPLFRSGSGIEQKLDALTAGALPSGPSYKSQMLVLSDCNAAVSSVQGQVLLPEARQAMLENCKEMAQSILAEEPSFSFAWFIDALVAEGQGNFDELNTSLVRSQLFGQRAQWLAQSRAMLALRNVGSLTPEALRAYEMDIATLAASDLGRRFLAQNYHLDADLQARATSVVETLSPDLQRQFVAAVRSANR